MDLFAPEQPNPLQQAKDMQKEATEAKKQAREVERRTGFFLAMLLHDMRFKLRSNREQRILRREEERLRLRNKWARFIASRPAWW